MIGGQLRDWLRFERRISEPNPDGGTVESWIPAFEDWGDAQPVSELSTRFIIRYRTFDEGGGVQKELGPDTHRLFWSGRRWTITQSLVDRLRSFYTLDCDGTDLLEATHLESQDRDHIDGLANIRPAVTAASLAAISAELAKMELGDIELAIVEEIITTTLEPADIEHLAQNPAWIRRIVALARRLAEERLKTR